jgi:signal transduction histidine kinase/ActR/RegA family two-component response regulator
MAYTQIDRLTADPDHTPRISPFRHGLRLLGFAAVSAVCVFAAIALTRETGRVAAIWLVNGFTVAALLKGPKGDEKATLIAAVLGMTVAFLLVGYNPALSAFYVLCNLLEIGLMMAGLNRFCPDGCRDLTQGRNLPIFTAISLAVPIPGACIAAVITDYVDTGEWLDVAITWYCADVLGLVTLIPLAVTLQRDQVAALMNRGVRSESLALFCALSAVLIFSFASTTEPRMFLIFPVLIFIAFRLGFAGATIAVAMTAIVAFAALIHEIGPFRLLHGTARDRIFIVQVFLAMATLTSLQVAAALAERRRLMAALQDSESALVEALHRAETGSRAKTDFLTTMSHELRTPLTAVLGIADNLLRTDAHYAPEQVRRMHEMQRDAGETLLGLITGILDLERIESGSLRIEQAAYAPDDVVEQCREMIETLSARKAIALTVEFESEVPPWLIGDAFKLRQVLTNLLGNAVKFTPERGAVTLTISADGARIRYSVRDTGIGIDPDRIPAIFERFTQAHPGTGRRYGGSGLGLAISQRLAHAMGGVITVTSEPSQGSTFVLDLPLIVDAMNGASADDDVDAPAPVRRYRILLAEDNATNREIIAQHLVQAGHSVVAVDDGDRAVAQARQEPFDVILMDVQMPRLDGLSATLTIRGDPTHPARETPILAVTANAIRDDEDRCREAGMDGFVAKPIRWPDLFATMDGIVAAKSRHGRQNS